MIRINRIFVIGTFLSSFDMANRKELIRGTGTGTNKIWCTSLCDPKHRSLYLNKFRTGLKAGSSIFLFFFSLIHASSIFRLFLTFLSVVIVTVCQQSSSHTWIAHQTTHKSLHGDNTEKKFRKKIKVFFDLLVKIRFSSLQYVNKIPRKVNQERLPDIVKQIVIALYCSTEVFHRKNLKCFPVPLCNRWGSIFNPLKQKTSPRQK